MRDQKSELYGFPIDVSVVKYWQLRKEALQDDTGAVELCRARLGTEPSDHLSRYDLALLLELAATKRTVLQESLEEDGPQVTISFIEPSEQSLVKEALEHLYQLMDASPLCPHPHYALSRLLDNLGEIDAAMEMYENLVNLAPNDTLLLNKVLTHAFHHRRYALAIKVGEMLIEQREATSRIHGLIGRAYAKVADATASREASRKSGVQMFGPFPPGLTADQREAMIEKAKRAVELEQGAVNRYIGMLDSNKLYSCAERHLQQAAASEPNETFFNKELAFLYMKSSMLGPGTAAGQPGSPWRDKRKLVRKHLKRHLRAHPDDIEAREELAEYYFLSGRPVSELIQRAILYFRRRNQ